MPGDYSRLTFDAIRRYTSVRMQQGRAQLDSDWNEQADITRHALETLARDLLGDAGVPGGEPGFAIRPAERAEGAGTAADLPAFTIGAGRLYVDGMLCVNDGLVLGDRQPDYVPGAALVAGPPEAAPAGVASGPASVNVIAAEDRPNKEPTGEDLQDVVPPEAEANPLPKDAGAGNKPAANPAYLVYLDAWQQEITAVEQAALREVALGGIDTAARERTVWQVRLAPFGGDGWRPRAASAGSLTPAPVAAAAMPQGGAAAHGVPPPGGAAGAAAISQAQPAAAEAAERPVVAARDADALAAWHAAERSLRRRGALTVSVDPPDAYDFENQLYRVEVHTAGAGGPQLKWARDNASVAFEVTAVTVIPPAETDANDPAREPLRAKPVRPELWVSVKDLGYDRAAIEVGAIVEIAGRVAALSGRTWPLVQVVEVDWNGRRIKAQAMDVLDWGGPTGDAEPGELLLRRWNGAETPRAWLPPDQKHLSGEWMELENGLRIAVDRGAHRPGDYWLINTRFGQNLTWPGNEWRPPDGPQHHYALLAVLFRDGDGWRAADCREVHQPTTQLTLRLGVAEDDIKKEREERKKQVKDEVDLLTGRINTLRSDLQARTVELNDVRTQVKDLQKRLSHLEAAWFTERTQMHHDLRAYGDVADGDAVALLSRGSKWGDIVLDEDKVIRADRSTAYRVYGVVITKDSTVATEQYESGDMVRVAVYGRVRCNVVGHVTPGDLLVASRRAGYAQRAGIAVALLRPGTVLGKALTASDPNRNNNEDVIDVMVTLG